jgi:hypothetical protein
MKLEAPRKTGKWLCDDIPHTGWICTEVKDGGSVCEMCEVTHIEYRHIMAHPRYPFGLECGCVCAGYMVEDLATEQLRELLYRWRKLQLLNRTPIEKLRRKGWCSTRWRGGRWRGDNVHAGHITGWHFGGRVQDSAIDNFTVEISNTDGWRFHLYHRRAKFMESEPFATDLLAAMAGIEHAEMLMADQQWVASQCETIAEERATRKAEQLAHGIQWTARQARELKREDIAAAVEAGQLSIGDAWHTLRYIAVEARKEAQRG